MIDIATLIGIVGGLALVETGPDGRVRVRKFAKEDRGADELKKANWSMLAWLRANEVKKFLIEPHPDLGDAVTIGENHIRMRVDAFTRFLTPASDMEKPAERAVNHRVEVVLTNEEVRRK